MAEKYYVVNPTAHALNIYDIVRITPGTEDEPSVTECTVSNQADLEAIQGVESWGLSVLSEEEYSEIIKSLDEDDEEEELPPPPEKIRVRNQKSKPVVLDVEESTEDNSLETPVV